MYKKFRKIGEALLKPNDRVLVALSGGADSICLAELFAESPWAENMALAHCNFKLRAQESDEDEIFVRRWAEKHNIKLFVKSFDTEVYAKENNMSIEMAARQLRYEYFQELALNNAYDVVAVAHNANDKAETLLLNLLRGTGLKGLCSMSESSFIPLENSSLRLIRPILSFSRKQILLYLSQKGQDYRTDYTNAENHYRRNKLRNEVFPILESINPSVINTFAENIKHFSLANAIVEDYFEDKKTQYIIEGNPCPKGQIEPVLALNLKALFQEKHLEYILYRFLEPYGFETGIIQNLANLLTSEKATLSSKSFTAANFTLILEREELRIFENEAIEDSRKAFSYTINEPKIYNLNIAKVDVQILDYSENFSLKQPEGCIIFDRSKLDFPFVLRSWCKGDWFKPFGLKGSKKLSDYFDNKKWSSSNINKVLVLAKDACVSERSHVLGVVGHRIDEEIKVNPQTCEQMIMIKILE